MRRGKIRFFAFAFAILFIALILFLFLLPGNRLKRLMKKGNDYLLQQDYEQAVDAYTRVLKIDNRNSSAYFARGDAYAGLGETQKARLDYIRAEELNVDLASAVEFKLSEMNALDQKANGSEGDTDAGNTENGSANGSSENAGEEIIPADNVPGAEETEVVFNQEAMDAAAEAGDPSTFPSQQEMILADVDVYNTFQASSEAYRTESSGPLSVFYDNSDNHIACILAPEGTYVDHANSFEHTLNAQYYYRLKDDGSVEPSFIYLTDEDRTEVHMIYLWENRVIRYVGPVDSSEYRQDFSPALTIEEFAMQVPQGVFAANACLELQWMQGR